VIDLFGLFGRKRYSYEFEKLMKDRAESLRRHPISDRSNMILIREVSKLFGSYKGGYAYCKRDGFSFYKVADQSLYIASDSHNFVLHLQERMLRISTVTSANTHDIGSLLTSSKKYDFATAKLDVPWENVSFNGANLAHKGKISALLEKLVKVIIAEYKDQTVQAKKQGNLQAKERVRSVKDLEKRL
jgi:hypothetical protein